MLPEVTRDQIRQVEVWRGDQKFLLRENWGRWWLAVPSGQETALGPLFRSYSSLYSNRQVEFDGQRWLQADDAFVGLIIYESSRVAVKELVPAGDAARLASQLDWQHPWRRVVMRGEGINPDPSAGEPDQLEILYSLPLKDNVHPALRRGNLLVAESEAVNALGEPVTEYLNLGALEFLPSLADSLVLHRQGSLLLKAHRDRAPAGPGDRRKIRPVDFWLTDIPVPGTTGLADRARHARSQNLLVSLERTNILRVLPPTADDQVLLDRERVRLNLWFPQGQAQPGSVSGQVILEIGFLNKERLPAGSPELAASDDGLEPVGLWRPDTGQLLQIPGSTITTARSWAR